MSDTSRDVDRIDEFDLHALDHAGDNSLGDKGVVETIVRQFVSGIIFIRADYLNGDLPYDQAPVKIEEMKAPMTPIFYGQDGTGFRPMAGWNSPEQLGEFICQNLQMQGVTPENAVFATFTSLSVEVLEALMASEGDNPKRSAEETKERMDLLVEQYTNLLRGVAPPGASHAG